MIVQFAEMKFISTGGVGFLKFSRILIGAFPQCTKCQSRDSVKGLGRLKYVLRKKIFLSFQKSQVARDAAGHLHGADRNLLPRRTRLLCRYAPSSCTLQTMWEDYSTLWLFYETAAAIGQSAKLTNKNTHFDAGYSNGNIFFLVSSKNLRIMNECQSIIGFCSILQTLVSYCGSWTCGSNRSVFIK